MILTIGPEWGAFKNIELGDAASAIRNLDGKDYARYTPTTAKQLTDTPAAGVALPTEARRAIISIATNPVRMRCGATDPTADEGLLLPAGTILVTDAEARLFLENVIFIDTATGASEITVLYGRRG
ncbi:MAG: hypothetical protein WC538_22175 [Thermoanaerobaculia bacterium]|jgi:hypothetical protein